MQIELGFHVGLLSLLELIGVGCEVLIGPGSRLCIAAELGDEAPIRRQYLEALVAPVGDVHDAFVVNGHPCWTVELTVALHRVFHSPHDAILFDTGHQTYVHKMVTGRREEMRTIRQYEGLSGFADRRESPHDLFGAGHAGTSISAATGMAVARDLRGEDHFVIAVIGR